ncbi:AsmA family protein [Aestuariispira ectoiniformans]|uniref:AsmA family protein n=1 Tax=Aestuariispira ectoiniformans TaxID=2775080 RepID=UPI00223AD4D8|nr:AsmA family protein [Aestuariispira ectoiniformans]
MRRALKYLGIIVGSLVALTAIAFAVIVNLDFNDYKYLIEGQVREKTGRDLEIRGRLDVDISMRPSVTMTDVRMANAPWGTSPDMATLDYLSATIDLWPLITDNVVDVQKVELRGVNLLVEKNRDGHTNLEFRELKTRKETGETAPAQVSTETGPAGLSLPILRDVRLSDIQMRYNDLGTGEKRNLVVDNLSIGGEGPFAPLKIDLNGHADNIPLKLSGELGSPSDMLNADRLWTVDLSGNLAGTNLSIAGGIDEPAAGRGINVVISTDTSEIGTLSRITEPLAGQSVPNLGPLKLSILLSGDADKALSASDISVNLGKAGGLQLQVAGEVADVLKQKGVDLKGELSVPDISSLSAVAGQDIPALGALTSQFAVSGDVGTGVALNDFAFDLKRSGVLQLSGSGGVDDLLTQRGVDMQVKLLVPDMKALPAVNGTKMPDAGRVDARFNIAGDVAGKLAMKDLKASLGRKDIYQLVLNGGIADLMKQAGIDLGFDFATPNLARLSSLAQSDLPAMAPISASGRLKGGATDAASVEGLALKIGESDLSGDVTVASVATRPDVKATFKSNVLRLEDVTPKDGGKTASGGGGTASVPSTSSSGNNGRVIPNDPIDFSGLRMADADVAVSVAKLLVPGGQFQDGQVSLILKDGMLTVEPIAISDDKGGKLTGNASLDARREAAALKVDLKADKLEISNLMRLAGQRGIIEGPMNMAVAMTSTGRSPHELAAGLTGKFNALVTEGYVNSDETRKAFGKATQIIADILLGNSKEKRIPLYCFVADYDAKNGTVNTNSLVLDTRVSTILGSGGLNLGSEKLNLTVTPTRDVMGIGAKIPIRVQGTFAKPKVFPDPALTAVGIGSALLGGATLPLTVLGGAALAEDNNSPCVNLRPENREKQTQPQSTEQPATEQPATPKKQLEDAGKKALEGILGNILKKK